MWVRRSKYSLELLLSFENEKEHVFTWGNPYKIKVMNKLSVGGPEQENLLSKAKVEF